MSEQYVALNESSENSVVMPLENATFVKMILEFLGKKEQLNYESKDGYVLTHNHIENFHFLLREKIDKEQATNINHFQVDISYDDGTSRKISGIENFSSFNETRDVSAVSVVMSWNILVQYPNAKNIENQKISVTFTRDKTDEFEHGITLSIGHTNQVWAVEILNMFKDHIKKSLIG